jgi:hypothetical protein
MAEWLDKVECLSSFIYAISLTRRFSLLQSILGDASIAGLVCRRVHPFLAGCIGNFANPRLVEIRPLL